MLPTTGASFFFVNVVSTLTKCNIVEEQKLANSSAERVNFWLFHTPVAYLCRFALVNALKFDGSLIHKSSNTAFENISNFLSVVLEYSFNELNGSAYNRSCS